MAKLWEFNERRVRNGSGCGASEIWIVAERIRDLAAGAIAARGCTILSPMISVVGTEILPNSWITGWVKIMVRGLSLVPRYHLLALVREPRV